MRSDIQNIVDKVHASMALIRQRIGWEAAHTRLEELNARTEDTNLWNDPENAQKLMRERQNISNAIDEYKSMFKMEGGFRSRLNLRVGSDLSVLL